MLKVPSDNPPQGTEGVPMTGRRVLMLTAMAVVAAFVIPLSAASAKVPGPNGRIVFSQFDANLEQPWPYTVNPDGTALGPLFQRSHSGLPHWAPRGRRIAIFCCDNGM